MVPWGGVLAQARRYLVMWSPTGAPFRRVSPLHSCTAAFGVRTLPLHSAASLRTAPFQCCSLCFAVCDGVGSLLAIAHVRGALPEFSFAAAARHCLTHNARKLRLLSESLPPPYALHPGPPPFHRMCPSLLHSTYASLISPDAVQPPKSAQGGKQQRASPVRSPSSESTQCGKL